MSSTAEVLAPPTDPPRCRLLRRHRWRRTEDEDGRRIDCTRCGWGWFEPRLFRVV